MKEKNEILEMIEAYKEDIKKAHKQMMDGDLSERMFINIKNNHMTKIEALEWVIKER